MAKQLNLFRTGQVIATALHTEMQQSYLEYAMSVIVGRALPDVRDGLKPVHRRILYAMHELGLTPDRPYRKCARVVGDVLGKYHPHGDQAVYDALVRMVQDFSCRYPLLAGHGNFGSVDNDPAAAMRYTETRLAPIGYEALLSEISAATVDFTPNFDNTQAEPVVLPAKLPVLLINGCSGIAVGMATNIPPHNIGELVDGLIAMIDSPDLSDDKLLDLIRGPDFPTGGEIVGTEGIKSAYTTGRGSIIMRGVASIEQIQSGSRGRKVRDCIVVTELPYQVNKATWIEKIADLANQGKIEGISDLRDESDRTGMRVVIEIKREVDSAAVLNSLYKLTPLQSTFGAIMLALVEGQPRQLTLRQMLQEFLNFRLVSLTGRYSHELKEAQKRLHLVEGLIKALDQVDRVIDILRNAPDGTMAKAMLQSQLQFSDLQGEEILKMPMRRLIGLERDNLQTEFEQLSRRIQQLQRLLDDRPYLLNSLKKELRSLKKNYNNPRRTNLGDRRLGSGKRQRSHKTRDKASSNNSHQKQSTPTYSSTPISQSPEKSHETPTETVLEFTYRGYVRRTSQIKPPSEEADSQGVMLFSNGYALKEIEDFTTQTQVAQTLSDVVVLTSDGKAYAFKVADIPLESWGTSPLSLLPPSCHQSGVDIAAQFIVSDYSTDQQVVTLTKSGRIKRQSLSEFANLTGSRGITAVKFKEDDDELLFCLLTQTGKQLLLATSKGRVLRLEVNDQQLPIVGRMAFGYPGIQLDPQEKLVGCVSVNTNDSFLLVSRQGYAKRIKVDLLSLATRGDKGYQLLRLKNTTDALVAIVPAPKDSLAIVLTNTQRLWQIPMDSIHLSKKHDLGDRLVQLQPQEILTTVLSISQ